MTADHLPHREIIKRLANYSPNILHRTGRQAAVMVAFVVQPELSILLTVRSAHLKSHPGDVSFPGGMVELSDRDWTEAALRETEEEVGLPANQFDILGSLSTALSKDGVPVHPVVGITDDVRAMKLCPDEISEAFLVPWRFFQQAAPEFTPIKRHGLSFEVPHFYYKGQHIWGLTAMILLELINLLEGSTWPLPQSLLAEHSALVDR